MTENSVDILLKSKFNKEELRPRLPSTAQQPALSDRVDSLVLPEEERGRMPLTKDKYIVREQPDLVQWERETRKFLRKLSPDHGHRVSAAMVYEWATGVMVADLMKQGASTTDLKRINKVLRFYFGQSYMTYICGRKVPNAYRVNPGYYITRHRPMTMTLYAEYLEGTLRP